MKRSNDRILTTHAGSLPRPQDLTRMMWDLIDETPVGARRSNGQRGLISDVIDTLTIAVEHPRRIAQRVGANDNSTNAAWPNLNSPSNGAAMASDTLWDRRH